MNQSLVRQLEHSKTLTPLASYIMTQFHSRTFQRGFKTHLGQPAGLAAHAFAVRLRQHVIIQQRLHEMFSECFQLFIPGRPASPLAGASWPSGAPLSPD